MTHLTSRFMTDDYLKRLPEFCMGLYQCLMEDSSMNVSHGSSFDETFLCPDLLRRIRPLEFQQLDLHLKKRHGFSTFLFESLVSFSRVRRAVQSPGDTLGRCHQLFHRFFCLEAGKFSGSPGKNTGKMTYLLFRWVKNTENSKYYRAWWSQCTQECW